MMDFHKDEKEEKMRRKDEKKRLKKEKKRLKKEKKEKKEREHKHDSRKRSPSSSNSSDESNYKINKHQKVDNDNNDNNDNSNKTISNKGDNEKYAINEVKEMITIEEGATKIITKSKLDFFSSLIKEELNAPQIGTIHAKGKTDDNNKEERNRGWICSKCDTSNATFNLQCSKCRAMKRMEATHRAQR